MAQPSKQASGNRKVFDKAGETKPENGSGKKGEKVQMVRVQRAHDGQRVDNYLMRELKGVPRSRIYRFIRRGEVRINKKRCKPETKLQQGDQLRIPPYTGSESREVAKLQPGLRDYLLDNILFEDDQVLVVNKPTGLAVHGGSGIRLGLIEALRQIKPEWKALELAHRIDRDTSGCVVVSKKSIFLKHIQREFKAKTISKTYLALVHGAWPQEVKAVDAPLKKTEIKEGEKVVRVSEEGKPSFTGFTVLENFKAATLLEARPETGRTHQIRVHCQHAGHAIVGDDRYTQNGADGRLGAVDNLCLHAWKIEFSVPDKAENISVEAPVDGHLEGLISKLKNSD